VTASNLCFRAAMLLVLAGMVWGLQMAITDDHSAFPAHAHLNLLGFVALFLFGIFYRLNPMVESNRLAIPQVWIWIASTVVMAIGVGLVHTGHAAGDPIAAVGSFAIFADDIVHVACFPGAIH
jgi:FtsH-binding integral membrane protein